MPIANKDSAEFKQELEKPMPLWRRPGFLIRRAHQIHQALFLEECAAFNLTPVQYGLLTELSEHPNTDQISLAREVGIDRTNVADVLRRLESRGLVSRQAAEHDRRMKLVNLTEAGAEVLAKMYRSMATAQLRLMAPLSEQERETFLGLLQRLVQENNHLGRTDFKPDRKSE